MLLQDSLYSLFVAMCLGTSYLHDCWLALLVGTFCNELLGWLVLGCLVTTHDV